MLHTVLDALFSKVYITDEMYARSIRAADFRREKLAIQELAARMQQAPGEVLPRFVELAMEMLEGCSAGLSLYEQFPAPGIFRWHQLCGTLARFEGATTPRDDSPCGVTLDQAAPVLTRHSELAYQWIADANIVLPEVLLVPLFIGSSEPLGTLWVVSDVEGHFTSEHARVASELATFVGSALHMQRTETRLRLALEAQQAVTHEMSHRVKNIFALMDAMIRQTVKRSVSKEGMAEALSGRLKALASAHILVLRDTSATIEAIDLETLVTSVVKPHDHALTSDKSRIAMNGPAISCNEQNATSVALVINELATNAVKYGSLCEVHGSVDIKWKIQDGAVHLVWTERGGPPVEPPTRTGFGSKLVALTLRQLGGEFDYDWQGHGLVASVYLPAGVFRVDEADLSP